MFIGLIIYSVGCSKPSDQAKDQPPAEGSFFFKEEVKLRFGITKNFDLNAWNSVEISLVNRGKGDFDGTVGIKALAFDEQRTEWIPANGIHRQVHIPGGEPRTYSFLYKIYGGAKVLVSLDGKDFRKNYEFYISQSPKIGRLRMLAVSGFGSRNQTVEFTSKLGSDFETFAKPVTHFSEYTRDLLATKAVTFDTVLPDRLPLMGEALDSYQLIILHGINPSTVPLNKIEALIEWVRRGGTLLAYPDDTWISQVPLSLQAALGIQLDGSIPSPKLSREVLPLLSDGASELYKNMGPREGTQVFSEGLVYYNQLGAGATYTYGFSLSDGSGTSAASNLQAKTARYALARAESFPGMPYTAIRAVEQDSPAILFGLCGFQIPGAGQVAWSFIAYLLFGFFIPFFVFLKLKKREWTFVVILLFSLFGTVGIYQFGLLASLEELEVDEISFFRFHKDGKTAEVASLLGIIDPSMSRVKLNLAADDKSEASLYEGADSLLYQPLRGEISSMDWRNTVRPIPIPRWSQSTEDGRPRESKTKNLYPNSMGYSRIDYRTTFKSSWYNLVEDGSSTIQVSNPFQNTLRVYLMREGRYQFVRKLSPGESDSFLSPIVKKDGNLQGTWSKDFNFSNEFWNRYRGYYYGHSNSYNQNRDSFPSDPFMEALSKLSLQAIAEPQEIGAMRKQNHWNNRGVATSSASSNKKSEFDSIRHLEPTLLLGVVEGTISPLEIDDRSFKRKGSTFLVVELPVKE